MSKLTKKDIEKTIIGKKFFYDDLLTICVLSLKGEFKVIGYSSCISLENYDRNIGENQAYNNAFEKIWELEGYRVKLDIKTDDSLDKAIIKRLEEELALWKKLKNPIVNPYTLPSAPWPYGSPLKSPDDTNPYNPMYEPRKYLDITCSSSINIPQVYTDQLRTKVKINKDNFITNQANGSCIVGFGTMELTTQPK